MGQDSPLLSFDHVSKDFYGNVVLHDVCFELRAGEILGLVGENGAGKTTLMRILFGMTVIAETGGYKGKVCIDGSEVSFSNPFDALDAGIGMVHQEFSLIPRLHDDGEHPPQSRVHEGRASSTTSSGTA